MFCITVSKRRNQTDFGGALWMFRTAPGVSIPETAGGVGSECDTYRKVRIAIGVTANGAGEERRSTRDMSMRCEPFRNFV